MDAGELRDDLVHYGTREYLRLSLTHLNPIATPAAGAEFLVTVPGGVIWELLAVHAFFTTSATVATRTTSLIIKEPNGATVQRYGGAGTQAAGTTDFYDWLAGLGFTDTQSNFRVGLPTPPVVLTPGMTVGSLTLNLDAGDQYSDLWYSVRSWSPSSVALHADQIVSRFTDLLEHL